MFYLILAILCSSLISIILRLSKKYSSNEYGMYAANYLVCTLCSLIYLNKEAFIINNYFYFTLILGIISGILYLVSLNFMKVNMDQNGIVLTSTFSKLGVLIPTLMAIFVFKELPSIIQTIGIIIAIVSIIVIHFEKDALKEGNKKTWLIILLLMSGMIDSFTNIFKNYGHVNYENLYLTLTFFAAFLLALIYAFKNKKPLTYKDILCGIGIGIPNYYSSKLVLMALSSIDAIIVFPVYSVSTLICITLAGVIFFKEELSKKKLYAIILIAIALCLLNL